MFTNLIESGSHKAGVQRKFIFVVLTTCGYAVCLVAVGIGSIFSYNANVDAQNYNDIVVNPVFVTEAPPVKPTAPPHDAAHPPKDTSNIPERTKAIAPVDMPTKVPESVGTKANDVPPVPKDGIYKLGNKNTEDNSAPPGPIGSGTGIVNTGPPVVKITEEPPTPMEKPKPHPPISGGVVNGNAIRLVTPPYPMIARSARASGLVKVQVLIDETGNVIAAHAISGHPLLQAAAVTAARATKFKPTTLSGQAVKVNGVIDYNFQLQ